MTGNEGQKGLPSKLIFKKPMILYDKWSNMGHLFKSITHRDLYDARLRDNMTLKEMVSNGQLMWPQE
ncbi:hypothetical protein Tco_0380355, partial [Tanacetum coccineum]